jgi:hypothetical protein
MVNASDVFFTAWFNDKMKLAGASKLDFELLQLKLGCSPHSWKPVNADIKSIRTMPHILQNGTSVDVIYLAAAGVTNEWDLAPLSVFLDIWLPSQIRLKTEWPTTGHSDQFHDFIDSSEASKPILYAAQEVLLQADAPLRLISKSGIRDRLREEALEKIQTIVSGILVKLLS